jgi:archaellum component FlaF (FlaF/FlaG flagellin family)
MQPLYLLGTGTTMSVSQTKLSFNDQKVGTTSTPQVLTFTNHGSTTLNISGFTLTGDFLMPAKTCTSKLAPGESCTVQVAFFPSAEGGVMGTLIVEENGIAADQRVSISLNGIGK